MKRILTIGYEQAELGDFIATLKSARVDLLLDVREIPLSRKRGFSKTALSSALADAGIVYRHERALGSPKPLRDQLKSDRDYVKFFWGFRSHLKGQKPLIERLSTELVGTVVLLCYERNFRECHRSVVAEALGKISGITPEHIGVVHGAERKVPKGKSLYPRQSVPAF